MKALEALRIARQARHVLETPAHNPIAPEPVRAVSHAELIPRAETLVTRFFWRERCRIEYWEKSAAQYNFLYDAVSIPPRSWFYTEVGYYKTLFHELAHATGDASRLDRFERFNRSMGPYAREEIIAETASYLLCYALGWKDALATPELTVTEYSARYINSYAVYLFPSEVRACTESVFSAIEYLIAGQRLIEESVK